VANKKSSVTEFHPNTKKGYAKYIFIFTMAVGGIEWSKQKMNKIHEDI
jgi:hypothetical protein